MQLKRIDAHNTLGLKVNACAIRGNATLHDLPQPSQLEALISTDTSPFLGKVSIQDIDKALLKLSKQYVKSDKELKESIPPEFHNLVSLWKPKEAAKLPPHRVGIDHQIELKRDNDGNEMQIPFGPLYDMSREELLVLRKTLNDLLDKGYIRASKSEAGAPVLFARKPGGGLRFCCDYRGLNAVTRSDRYPLPLISDTIRNLSKAIWFTKLDVVAAFHKISVMIHGIMMPQALPSSGNLLLSPSS
ncbi:hypothetical protein K3495_g15475 [Podosphaera aphanis]|nr:hypothetical protein K3495_g15475 [Podosphaera aphanis]